LLSKRKHGCRYVAWVAAQEKIGKGKQAVKSIYRAYETESNPWSPFFKPVGAVPAQKKK
jgi:hypothetical protein